MDSFRKKMTSKARGEQKSHPRQQKSSPSPESISLPGPKSSEQQPSTSTEDDVDLWDFSKEKLAPEKFMKYMVLSGRPGSSSANSSTENSVVEVPLGDEGIPRMDEDGYPLVVDFGASEREDQIRRDRLVNEVIDEQNGADFGDPAVDEDVISANMRRLYLDETGEPTNQENVENIDQPSTSRQEDNEGAEPPVKGKAANRRIIAHAESAIANYMSKKFSRAEEEVREQLGLLQFDREQSTSSSSSKEETRAVNILPGRAANADANPCGWQATKKSLKERISYMFANDILADVYFIVGKDDNIQKIPAHKFVLSIGSVVFDAMFNGGLTPQNSKEPLEIELPDVEPSAFLTLLKFLYTDEVSIGPESVMTTLYTAKKYAVPAMEMACVDFLKQSLGADNAFMLLAQARLFDEPQLEQLCLELIDQNTKEAMSGEGFTDIDLSTLCDVLKRDTLRVREASLFQGVVRWATEECKRKSIEPTNEARRSVLGNALQLIRYPLMTVEEFAETAAQSGLLECKEVVDLFLYFHLNPKPLVKFMERPRCTMAGKELCVARFQRNEVRWGYCGQPDRIKFTVDRKIHVTGFGLYGGIAGTHEYGVTIQIIHCGTGNVLAANETSFACDGSSKTFRVYFMDPVEIITGVTYIASATLKGPDSHYGTKGLRRIVHQSSSGNVTFQFTYAAGNNNGTSVEDGQIPEIYFYT